MIKLFHCVGARSFRALWMLEEMGVPYDLSVLPYPPRQSDEFLSLSSMNTVPLLIDRNIRMEESVAICIYLATAYSPDKLAVAPHESPFADWLEWVIFGETSLTYPLSLVIHYGGTYEFDKFMESPRRIDCVVNYYTDKFQSAIHHLAAVLKNREFVSGDRFTAADVSVAFNFRLAEFIGLSDLIAPVRDYWQRVSSRPAYLRADAAESRGASVDKRPE